MLILFIGYFLMAFEQWLDGYLSNLDGFDQFFSGSSAVRVPPRLPLTKENAPGKKNRRHFARIFGAMKRFFSRVVRHRILDGQR